MAARSLAIALLATGALAAPASAQDTLSPDGPATLQAVWRGAVPAIAYGPAVVVRWSVTVGSGGNAGPVRFRNLADGAVSPRETLPAEPGTYVFGVNPGLPCATACQLGLGLGLDQEVGGHAIITTHPSQPEQGELNDPHHLYALDVFRPPLGDDARGGEASERRDGEQLLVRVNTEPDADCDHLGDRTQDTGDLQLVDARVKSLRGGRVTIAARVRNAGATARDLPRIAEDPTPPDFACRRAPNRLAPRGEEVLTMTAPAPGPARIRVRSEGPDATPGNNERAVRALLDVSRVRRTDGGVRVTATTSRAGTLRASATLAGVRLTRAVRLARAGRRTFALAPRTAADRARLAAAFARNAKLGGSLRATLGRTTTLLSLRV